MRLILFDPPPDKRANFNPVALSRPVWQLRCGMTDLATKLIDKLRPALHAGFVPSYMAAAVAEHAGMPINDAAPLSGDDLLLVNGRVKADTFNVSATGASEVGLGADGEVLYVRVASADAGKLQTASIDDALASAKESFPCRSSVDLPVWSYLWDFILANPDEIMREFSARSRSGVEGTLEEPSAIRGASCSVPSVARATRSGRSVGSAAKWMSRSCRGIPTSITTDSSDTPTSESGSTSVP